MKRSPPVIIHRWISLENHPAIGISPFMDGFFNGWCDIPRAGWLPQMGTTMVFPYHIWTPPHRRPSVGQEMGGRSPEVLEIAPTELSDDLQWAADGAWVMRTIQWRCEIMGFSGSFSWIFMDFDRLYRILIGV